MTLQPVAQTLVPGHAASFIVSLSPFSGFSAKVTLSVVSLPAGVTAVFSPNPVQPPGTSILTLTAATSAAAGSFSLNVSAAGGGITNTTSSSVTVNFGLLPTCGGAITGLVSDVETGLPIRGAFVGLPGSGIPPIETYTDTNGIYVLTGLPLGTDNAPIDYSLDASAPGYYNSYNSNSRAYAVCGATNTANLQLLRQLYGSVSGTVTIQGGGPAAGATVHISGAGSVSVVTDTNGNFQGAGLALGYPNSPTDYSLNVQPAGCWMTFSNAYVYGNSNTVLNLVAEPVCYLTVTGGVVYADTLLPATNAYITVTDGLGYAGGYADAHGNYALTNVTLNSGDRPFQTVVSISANGYNSGTTNVALNTCGVTVSAGVVYLAPNPRPNYGNLSGHVYDLQTGLPIASAYLYFGTPYDVDTNGAFTITNLYVGVGITNALAGLEVFAPGYYTGFTNTMIYSGLTVTQDVYLLKEAYGTVEGTVRDSVTSLPLTNVMVVLGDAGNATITYTDVNGNYLKGSLSLSANNAPISVSVTPILTGYFASSVRTVISNGATNVVNLVMIKVCPGATIIGSVVNALTLQPITNATVSAIYVNETITTTDTNGNFILTNVPVGSQNSPLTVDLRATAPGYNPQSKFVTIFCNATVFTEFGAPPTALGTIQGYVTNAVTGQPLAGAFIGSEFGEAAATDTNGFYQLTQAPLGANNASRAWNITAIPTNYPAQTLPVTVSSNGVAILNFGFDLPPAQLQLTETSTPKLVAVGSNLVYTITLSNNAAAAANVQLSDQLAPALAFLNASITNPPGGAFTAPVYSNGVVTTMATNLGAGESLVLVVTGSPTAPGALTNIATVTSSTPDVDPTGTNRTAMVVNTALAPLVPHADLGLAVTAAPNPIVASNQLTYSFSVTNAGPANAPGVVLNDTLPANTVFVSASASQGSFTQNGPVLQWDLGAMTNSGNASVSLVVTPLVAGLLTNTATVAIGPGGGAVTDTNQINNIASVVTMVSAPVVVPAFGVIQGYVTNALTGLPLAGASIGSQIGGTATTDASGFYQLTQAPLGANNSSRAWNITASPANFPAQTRSVTVSFNTVSTLNFGFSPPPTQLQVTETSAPTPVTVGSNLVYTITLFNNAAVADNVQLTDQLAPTLAFLNATITNPSGGAFTAPVYSNGVVTTTAANFASGGSLVLVVTGRPTVPGALTNLATVTSSTPDVDPSGTNRTAMVVNPVLAPLALYADLGLSITAAPNPIVASNQLTYTFFITNAGPADAPGVVLNNTLPANTTFITATSSQGSFTQNGPVLQWDLGAMTNSGNAIVSLVVTPQVAGLVTNSATVAIGPGGGAVTDTNQINNTASAVAMVTAPAVANVSVQAIGGPVFNPQTGLFQQTVQFHNLGAAAVAAVRLFVLDLPANVALYNASGSTNGLPYAEYDQPVAPGDAVNFVLEYYSASRGAFVTTNFTATTVTAAQPAAPAGTMLQLDQTPSLHDGQILIEFASIPGASYVIQYSSDMQNWVSAMPPIVAAGTRVQWIDSGPPKTVSAPASVGSRFYRVLQTGGPRTNLP